MWKSFRLGLDKTLEFLTALSMFVLLLDVTWQVITRFILKNPSSWTEEFATFLIIWVGLLGSAVALYRGAHLGIDYFVGKLSYEKRLFTQVIVFAIVAAFSVSVLLIGGIQLVNISFMLTRVSPALGIQMGYVYLAVPISGFFISLYSIEFFVENLLALIKSKKGA